ncbi:hypothetical protein, partial [Nocardioides sp. Soil805]|uniref:hypothetical protein n=1 Tax=Nocardioides sp. Soil805 TaxID=1736416 RepID=UPI000AB0F58E
TRAGAGDCTVPSSLILPGGSEPHWSSAPLSAPETPALENTVLPTIKGTGVVGRTLKASPGRWSVAGLSYTYRWFRDGKKIRGRAGSKRTHTVVRSERGKRLTVRVTARGKGHDSRSATSAPVRIKR